MIPIGGTGLTAGLRNLYLLPSRPLDELRKQFPHAQIEFDPGISPAEAVLAARRADIAIVFAIRVEGEGFDSADLSLPWGQDAVIAAVSAANPNTVVVLETGNPVSMPWRESVNAIVQAWYPGQAGAQAIAEIIAGQVNPSGRLPITFPVDLGQTPRPELPDLGAPLGTPSTIRLHRRRRSRLPMVCSAPANPDVRVRSWLVLHQLRIPRPGGDWRRHRQRQFQRHQHRRPRRGRRPPAVLDRSPRRATVTAAGIRAGRAGARETRRVTIEADPRLLARYDGSAGSWRISPGGYTVAVGASAVSRSWRLRSN